MGSSLLAYPKVIYTQTTAPTGANAGALWWDTDDLALFYYSGSSWIRISSSADASGWESPVSQLMLEILRLSAEGTLTAPDYDSLFVDYFADADGQDGTIDTGNTDAVFATDSYNNSSIRAVTKNLPTEDTGETLKEGIQISCSSDFTISTIVKQTGVTATTCYIGTTAGGSEVGSAAFSGNTATFNTSTLSASTTYFISVDSGGASYTDYKIASGFSGEVQNEFTLIGGVVGSDASGYLNALYGINTVNASVVLSDYEKNIQTNAQALSFAPAYCLVHSKDLTLTGTGSITYDISFDGGSTWDSTGNSLDTKITVTDGSSKSMVIKLVLDGASGANYTTIKDYEVILWSS